MSALPKIKHSLYTHHLLGLGKKVSYRPFTVQEQKILLLAKEETKDKDSKDSEKHVLNAVQQIITNCTLGKIDVSTLATFDIEDLFVRIRAKSVGEVINSKYRYDYEDENGAKKSEFIEVAINIDDVKIIKPKGHEKKIALTDTIGVVMKYPTFEILEGIQGDDDLAMSCFDYIYDKDEIYDLKNVSKEELVSFYDDIETSGLLKIKQFFDTMPKLYHEVEVSLKNGEKEIVRYEGLKDFFI